MFISTAFFGNPDIYEKTNYERPEIISFVRTEARIRSAHVMLSGARSSVRFFFYEGGAGVEYMGASILQHRGHALQRSHFLGA
jgi:hypothetical protein